DESERSRNEVVTALLAAGLLPSASLAASSNDEQNEELRKTLSLRPGEKLNNARLGELLRLLVKLVDALERVMTATWKEFAPGSGLNRPQNLGAALGRFAVGDQSKEATKSPGEIEKLQKLVAGLIEAIRDYAV